MSPEALTFFCVFLNLVIFLKHHLDFFESPLLVSLALNVIGYCSTRCNQSSESFRGFGSFGPSPPAPLSSLHLLYSLPSFSFSFYILTKFMTSHGFSSSFVETLAGFTAGVMSTLSLHPLDMVKTRLQGEFSSYKPEASRLTLT